MPDTLTRRCLPTRRRSFTTKVRVGGQAIYLTCGLYADGSLGEIWIDASRCGSAVRGLLGALAISISIGLQHGVSLSVYTAMLRDFRFEPDGPVVGSEAVQTATSILNFIAQQLEADFPADGLLVPDGKVAGEYVAGKGV